MRTSQDKINKLLHNVQVSDKKLRQAKNRKSDCLTDLCNFLNEEYPGLDLQPAPSIDYVRSGSIGNLICVLNFEESLLRIRDKLTERLQHIESKPQYINKPWKESRRHDAVYKLRKRLDIIKCSLNKP